MPETEEQDTVTEPTDDQEQEHDDQEQEDEPTSNEAARYRRRLREVETEREALGLQLHTVQRQLIERVAGDVSATARLADVSDLWRDGIEVADLVDEHGAVDHTKVEAAVAAVVTDHPSWQARFPDLGQGRRTRTATSGPSWSDVLSQQT